MITHCVRNPGCPLLRGGRHAAVVVVVVAACCVVVRSADIRPELSRISSMRAGESTDSASVDKACADLLEAYTQPSDQGRIFFTWTRTYAQSGAKFASRTAELARKTLDYPLKPAERMQVCVDWGDALQFVHAGATGSSLAAARREIVIPYLAGLKESLGYSIPDKPVPLPVVGRYRANAPKDSEFHREMVRRHEIEWAAWNDAILRNELLMHRDTLTRQIADLYSRLPLATDEIRTKATEVLQNQEAVERLMAAVEAAVGKRINRLAPDIETLNALRPKVEAASPTVPVVQSLPVAPPTPVATTPPREAPSAGARVTWVVVTGVAVAAFLVLICVVAFRRGRRPRA